VSSFLERNQEGSGVRRGASYADPGSAPTAVGQQLLAMPAQPACPWRHAHAGRSHPESGAAPKRRSDTDWATD
jgi:hypothetical protein